VSKLVAQSSILRPDKTLNIAPATVRFSESQMWLVVGIAKIMLFPRMLSWDITVVPWKTGRQSSSVAIIQR
jgi:hypothetical protein